MEPEVRQRFERIEAILEAVSRSQAASDARFEKRMKGFEKLVQIGMKEIAQLRRTQRQTDEKINALIDAQQRTEASLQRFIDSLRKSSNGR